VPGPVSQLYRDYCRALSFEPQNNGVKLEFYDILSTQMMELWQQAAWKFAMRTGYVYARADYTTGTALFTNGSRVVTGTGTAWTGRTAEEAWIAPGSDPSEDQWVRIGRVGSDTQILLVDPYPGTTTSSASYVVRWRFCPLPRDVLSYKGITARVNNQGPLEFISAEEAEALYLPLNQTGNPVAYCPAIPPQWRVGAGIPDTPGTAPTLTLAAGAGLTVGVTYSVKYTWIMHGIETGASPVATITTTAGNLQISVSQIEEVGALQGRSARIYLADATGIFYKVADTTATPYVIDGSSIIKSVPFYEGAYTQYIKFWPRASQTSWLVDLRYHARPRLIQKDSDYIDGPIDVESAVVYGAIAAAARSKNKAGIAAQYQVLHDRQVDLLRRTEIAEAPQLMVRVGIGGGRSKPRIPLISPTVRTN
jgi:hypothetical protein